MASLQDIKRRIKSITNIGKVTRAMQMVAASKMRRAQEQAIASRPYAAKSWEILTHLVEQAGDVSQLHPLLMQPEKVEKVAILLITSDKGLAGGYNGNTIRKTTAFMQDSNHQEASLITVGRKGRDFMVRYGRNVVAEFSEIPARPSTLDIAPISHIVIDGFLSGEYDEVYIAYTDFVNTLVQEPTLRLLLPIQPGQVDSKVMEKYLAKDEKPLSSGSVYTYEPDDPTKLLDTILPRLTELQIYQAYLESRASEESARMIAMRNATESANELVGDLTLTYNRVRQESITSEMLDIAGGAEALAQAS
ncbi:ATP synthase F1 subunit gamma [Anaerolineales bacterium HSG6]|nr:ATP synthase F1 subunit gamma [Anaerolineales bacterium HSG6]MDM8530316.1 ATP synthase F1 subunit gamma [Anaerolineales bacterium HSG25]